MKVMKVLLVLFSFFLLTNTYAQPAGPGDWSKVRLYGHAYRAEDFTDEQYEFIKDNYYMFGVAKGNASAIYGFGNSDEALAVTATKIRQNNPSAKILYYWSANSAYDFNYSSIDNIVSTNPNWVEEDATGVLRWTYPTTEAQNWWVNTADNVVDNTDFDGVFADGLSGAQIRNVLDPIKENLDNMNSFVLYNGYYVRQWLEIYADSSVLDNANGVFVEVFFRGTVFATATAEVLMDALLEIPNDKYIICRSSAGEFGLTHDFSLAAYLIVANDNTFYSWGGDENSYVADDTLAYWTDDFSKEIGEPLGVATKNGYVYTRVFEHCLVEIDIDNKTSSIIWGQNNSLNSDDLLINENEVGFCSVDGAINNNQPGYTGDGFVNTDNAAGNGINWLISGSAGSYTFTWRHACPSDRIGNLLVNGESILNNITLDGTGDWAVWEENTSVTVNLPAGIKDVRLESVSTNGLGNIDYMKAEGPNVTAVSCNSGNINFFTIQENETGFCSVDGAINNNQPDYTGDGFVNTDNATGNGINWKISGDAGLYTFIWNHACPSDRQGELFVNGVSAIGAITFNKTTGWNIWEENTSVTVNLPAGIKDIRLESISTNGLGNIDYMKVVGANTEPVLCSSITSFTIQENEIGFCSVDGAINNNQPGYTGDGFANTDNASGNGVNWKIFGDSGSYTFTWNHACPSDRQGELFVNGVSVLDAITFNKTTEWNIWKENTSVTVYLPAGVKDIRIESISTNGLGNIDYMKVEGLNANAVSCGVSSKTDIAVSKNGTSLENDNAIRVYSNLSESTFTLSKNVTLVEVYSMSGQLVKSFPRNETNFDILELSSGVYVLKIVSENGLTETFKIIKK